jgi:hypothetical protein
MEREVNLKKKFLNKKKLIYQIKEGMEIVKLI